MVLPADYLYSVDESMQVHVRDTEEQFVFSAPVTYDAEGRETMATVRLESADDGIVMRYILDPEFLATATYPVTIDPVLHSTIAVTNIQDTTLGEGQTLKPYTENHLKVGKYNGSVRCVGLLQFNTLAILPASDTIIGAVLRMYSKSSSTSNCIAAYEVLKPWTASSVYWGIFNPDSTSNISPEALECIAGGSAGTALDFDLTNLYRKWCTRDASGKSNNHGVAFRSPSTVTATNYSEIYSANASTAAYRPVMYQNYVSHAGLEGWWQYEQMSAGRAGTVYADLFNGNMVLEHSDTAMSGNRVPVSVNHYYNSCLSDDNNYNCGYGWKTDAHQKVTGKTLNGVNYYVWEDGDGTEHYFEVTGSQPYKDCEGMEMELTYTSGSPAYITITDKEHNTMRFNIVANQLAWLVSASDACGNTVTYAYSSGFETAGRIDTITDPVGRVAKFNYPGSLLSNIRIPAANGYRYVYYTYDSSNRLTGIRYSELGGTSVHTTYGYEGSTKLLTKARNCDGIQVNVEYEATSLYVTVPTNEAHRLIALETQATNASGAALEYGARQEFEYKHMCAAVTANSGYFGATDKRLHYQFNAAGNVICVRDDLGYARFTKFSSTLENKPTDESSLRRAVVNLLLHPDLSSGWSAAGNAVKDTATICMGAASVKLTANGATSRYYQTVTLPAGNKYTFSAYVKTQNNAYPYIRTETAYDANGNYTASTKDALGNQVTQVVDANDGTLTSATDPNGQTVNYTYDAARRATAVQTTGDGKTYRNAYTYENDRIKTVSHNTTADNANDVNYTFGYDDLGRKTTVKVGTQVLSTNEYDPGRNTLLTGVEYGNGGKAGYTYDEFDRLTAVRYDNDTEDRLSYEYGANGQVAQVTHVVDESTTRYARTDYDLADRPCQTVLHESVEGGEKQRLYKTLLKYDKLNNLTQFAEDVQTEIHTTGYTYDRDNRVTEIAYDGSTHKVKYTYDELGRVATRVAECGATAGKLTSTYGYVGGGYGTNSTTPLVASITQEGVALSYAYDNRGNITSETRNGLTTTYVYDALGPLVRVNDPHEDATWVFNYDRGGNITSKVRYAYTTGTLGTVQETIPYAYNDSNWKDKLTAYNDRTFTYDVIGNPTSDGIWSYEWEVGRRLKSMSAEGTALNFKYDHNGLRTQKIVQQDWYPVTTNYLLHGKLITHMTVNYHDWEENEQQDTLHFFYDTQSRPAKVSFNGVIYTYIHNLQGDIIGLLDSAGNLVVEYKYDAWGKLLSTTGTMANTLGKRNPFRYRSYVYDEESGLYYLRSRYYNPEWSRFVNADACMGWSSLIGKNLYMYCSNGPIVFSDSNGFSPEVTLSPSRPENWDTAFYARMLRQKIKATITRVAKTIVNKIKSVYNTVKKAVKNAVLVAKASQLAQHGGGVIKFNTGLKATCYTSEYWYRTNRPASSWGSFAFDAGLTASGAAAGKISALSKISPYLEGIGIGMLAIDACINLQVDQINRCIDSSGSIGWISWERSVNAAPMPTAWDSTTFTPGEWFGEIESVEFFE